MEACEQEVDSSDATPEPAERKVSTPHLEPAIIAHPQQVPQGGQPSCSNLSLCSLLEFRRQREKLSFEVGFGWGL